jgi:hypothetical protein
VWRERERGRRRKGEVFIIKCEMNIPDKVPLNFLYKMNHHYRKIYFRFKLKCLFTLDFGMKESSFPPNFTYPKFFLYIAV